MFTFISADVIARLENGSFAPLRTENRNTDNLGRRQTFSPLAMIKRCIRYEPAVFQNRKSLILRLAHSLNNPIQKIILIGGPQGCGKTSLTRGLVELMGSRNEQVLWFDINRYTDFEEISHFLLHSIRDVFVEASAALPQTGSGRMQTAEERRLDPSRRTTPREDATERRAEGNNGDPETGETRKPSDNNTVLEQLATLIRQVAELPLLLVLDNVEYLVDPTLRFNSGPFKEVLNFLLGFPNIKMLLMGERLPYADMFSDQGGIEDIRLIGLEEADSLILLHARQKKQTGSNADTANPNPDPAVLEQALPQANETAAIRQLYQKTQGFPWLLKLLLHLNHQSNLDFFTLNRLLHGIQASARREKETRDDDAIDSLLLIVDERLPDQQRALLQLLSFLRHPVNATTLQAIAGVCYPGMLHFHSEVVASEHTSEPISAQSLEDLLEHSLLRPLLKISYPPQDVLAHVRNRKQNPLPFRPGVRPGTPLTPERTFKPGYELYQILKRLVYTHLPAPEKERMHRLLHDLYLRESSREAHNRILRIKNRVLLNEARFHEGWLHKHPSALPQASLPPASPAARRLETTARFQAPNVLFPGFPGLTGQTEDHSFSESILKPKQREAGSFQSISPTSDPELFPLSTQSENEWRFPDEYFPAEEVSATNQESHTEQQTTLSHPEETPPTLTPEQTRWERFQEDNPELLSLKQKEGETASTNKAEQNLLKQLAKAIHQQDEPATVQAFLDLARYRQQQGAYNRSHHYLQQALTLQNAVSLEVQIELYQMDGSVQKALYQHNAALAMFKKAARLLETKPSASVENQHQPDIDSPLKAGNIYAELGEIYAYRQQISDALAAFEKALQYYTTVGASTRLAEIHFQMGELYEKNGQTQQAFHYYQQAIDEGRANGHTKIVASSLSNLGNLHLEGAAWEEAETAFNATLRYDKESGNTEGQLNTLACLISLYKKQERWNQAEQIARQGLLLAESRQILFWQSSFHSKLGEIFQIQGQNTHARSHYQLAQATGGNELSSASLEWLAQKIKETGA